jgi:hypothetical protein
MIPQPTACHERIYLTVSPHGSARGRQSLTGGDRVPFRRSQYPRVLDPLAEPEKPDCAYPWNYWQSRCQLPRIASNAGKHGRDRIYRKNYLHRALVTVQKQLGHIFLADQG